MNIICTEFVGWRPFDIVLTTQEQYTIRETERDAELMNLFHRLDVQLGLILDA